MKRLQIASFLILVALHIQAQSPIVKISDLDLEKTKTELDSLKPLVTVELKGEKFLVDYLESEDVLNAISPNSIKSIGVIKGMSATNLYGEKGVNGIISITLFNTESNAALFEKLKNGKTLPSLINTDANVGVDDKTSFSLSPSQNIENAKIETIGKSWLRLQESSALVRLSLSNQEVELDQLSKLDRLDISLIKSIDVQRYVEGKNNLNSNGRDVIRITLIKTPKTKRFFRQLKRAQNK